MPENAEIIDTDAPSYERPRGVLTSDDRMYLIGEKELSDQAERDARYRIRERVKNALWDFQILRDFQEQRDREKIFETFEDEPSFLSDILSYVFLGQLDLTDGVDDAKKRFGWLIESAVYYALSSTENIVDEVSVDITVDVRQPDVAELMEKVEAGEAQPNEVIYLIDSDDLTPQQGREVTRYLMELVKDGKITLGVAQVDDDGKEHHQEFGPDDAQAVLNRFDEEDVA